MTTTATPKKLRGFAAMTPERRLELARQGGQKAAALGLGFRFDSATGAAAARGRKPRNVAGT